MISRGAEDVPMPSWVDEPPDALGLEDDEGVVVAPKVDDAFPGIPACPMEGLG